MLTSVITDFHDIFIRRLAGIGILRRWQFAVDQSLGARIAHRRQGKLTMSNVANARSHREKQSKSGAAFFRNTLRASRIHAGS
jgi:hypothetical protein